MRMKKIVSFEFGDEQNQYSRISFRLDLRVLAALLVVIIFLLVILVAAFSSFGHQDLSQNENETANVSTCTTLTSEVKIADHDDPRMVVRRNLIVNMTVEVWMQQNRILTDKARGIGLLQMMSSLWVMGLREQYEQSKWWIATNYFGRDFNNPVFTFNASTEYLGSLLSCFALTNDTTWLDKAKLVGNTLKDVFDTPTGLPNKYFTSKQSAYSEANVYLVEAGGQHLELIYLADMTNDLDMKAKAHKARTFLQKAKKRSNNGRYMDRINVQTGEWSSASSSLVWPFYQCLIKSYAQSGGQDEQAIEMYREAIDAVLNNSINSSRRHKSQRKDKTTYEVRESNKTSTIYDDCHLGGMFALGAHEIQLKLRNCSNIEQQNRIHLYWTLAREITENCHNAANRTETKLPGKSDDIKSFSYETAAAFAESYLVLWRLTHETKYRDYAWELAQAIHKHCRTEEGKCYQVKNVNQKYSSSVDWIGQPNLNFLSATLKYLYLTFSEDTLLPIDQWVFNRVGQALPVCGKNAAYPKEKCAL